MINVAIAKAKTSLPITISKCSRIRFVTVPATAIWNLSWIKLGPGDLLKFCGLGQMLTNFRQEFAGAVGLRHVVIAAGCLRDLLLSVERIGGDRDDRDRSQLRIGFDPARGGVAVHDR